MERFEEDCEGSQYVLVVVLDSAGMRVVGGTDGADKAVQADVCDHCHQVRLCHDKRVILAFVMQAVKYVRENPDEVCPAGWTPGDKTMKPNPKESKEFFAAL
jgi:hypothetical protein